MQVGELLHNLSTLKFIISMMYQTAHKVSIILVDAPHHLPRIPMRWGLIWEEEHRNQHLVLGLWDSSGVSQT